MACVAGYPDEWAKLQKDFPLMAPRKGERFIKRIHS